MTTTFDFDAQTLQAIFDAHGLGTVRKMERAGRGRNNPVFMVNDALVIRFDGIINAGVSRFHGEKRAYDALRQANIPAPQVIVVDDSRTIAPHDYLIMTKIEGSPLINAWPTLSPNQREKAAYEAGRCLALMHGITFATFGKLYGTERIFETWYAYVQDTFRRYCRGAADEGVIAADIIDRMEKVIERHRPIFDSVTPARLVHWDYHFENILQQDGEITGILDFEWALSGDVAHDFNRRDQWEADCPGSRAPLYAGYASIRPLEADHDVRVMLYQIIWLVDCIVDDFDPDETTTAHDQLLAILQNLE